MRWMEHKRILLTGGCGFIGSAVVRALIAIEGVQVLNLDKMTYAANPQTLKDLEHPNLHFVKGDIVDRHCVQSVFDDFKPDGLIHLAAETHVDRSIDGPADFLRTNVQGTYCLLEETQRYLDKNPVLKEAFRFIHVSTDEVYGELGATGLFHEDSPYRPNSPYSASKASSDHLVRAWGQTYGLPVITTNCSNNFGPYQFPEKLIPRSILRALNGQSIEIYGEGKNIRDWLFVEDHAQGLIRVLEKGKCGETYLIGGSQELTNLDLIKKICAFLDEERPQNTPYEGLIEFVRDRPGHDHRYAIDASKIKTELGWAPEGRFEDRLRQTVRWYLAHEDWWKVVFDDQRLG
jgi:dTDP-glucose 4,6-dehydratase